MQHFTRYNKSSKARKVQKGPDKNRDYITQQFLSLRSFRQFTFSDNKQMHRKTPTLNTLRNQ